MDRGAGPGDLVVCNPGGSQGRGQAEEDADQKQPQPGFLQLDAFNELVTGSGLAVLLTGGGGVTTVHAGTFQD